MQKLADELEENWYNGNLTFVINEVLTQPTKAKSALLAALLATAFATNDRMVFFRMLSDKVNER